MIKLICILKKFLYEVLVEISRTVLPVIKTSNGHEQRLNRFLYPAYLVNVPVVFVLSIHF